MGAALVMLPSPRLDFASDVVKAHEPVLVQTFLAKPPVKALNRCVVRRRTRSAELNFDPALVRPFVHRLTDELSAVICLHRVRCATLLRYCINNLDHVFSLQALTDMDR